MSTIDLIAEARMKYLSSPKRRIDWINYLKTVQALRAVREGGPDS